MINVSQPRPRVADTVLHTLVDAHRSAWAALVSGRGDTVAAERDCDSMVGAMALIPARTLEGLAAKASAVRIRLLGNTVFDMIGDGCDADNALLASFAEDALAQLEAI
jgi:hypothetical protein